MGDRDGRAEDASFAERLRGLRQARSLTQEELAERSGLTVKAVGAWERGERLRPYPHSVRALADALDLDEADRAALVSSVPRPPRRSSPSTPSTPAMGEPSPVRLPAPAPAAATALVGRDEELAGLVALVGAPTTRVVTLTGPGGVGKTRLATEVAARVSGQFPGGAALVEAADLREAPLLLGRLAAALGVPETGASETVAGLVPYLAGRRMLVLLDNLEQVLGCAVDVAELVARCPDLTVLATSRAPLRIRAEREVKVAPLELPPSADPADVAASPAVRLLLDRAGAAGASIEVGPGNAETIATICRRLDGLPLAIELAAATTRLLTPASLLDRLDAAVEAAGIRDLPDRQQTMTATVDWSHALLDPDQRDLFARLSVFAGGFGLEAAEVVADPEEDLVHALSALVDQSLVLSVPGPGGTPRFRLLEPVRQYAAERLAGPERVEVAARHAAYFLGLSRSSYAPLRGSGLVSTLDRLGAEHANLGVGLLRLVDTGRHDEAAEQLRDLWLYLALRGHAREGLSWADRLTSTTLGDAGRAALHTAGAGLRYVTDDIAGMRVQAGHAVTWARVTGHEGHLVEACVLAAGSAIFAGDLEAAVPFIDEAAGHAQSAGDGWGRVQVLTCRAQLALMSGDVDGSDTVLTEAEQLARALENAFTLATVLNLRATVTSLREQHEASAVLLAESTRISVDARLGWTLGYAVPALAGAAVRLGDAEAAAVLFGASASLSAAFAVEPGFPTAQQLSQHDLALVRSELGEPAFRAAWDAGRGTTGAELAVLAERVRQRVRG